MLTHLSLFSGIGGFDIAAEWAGFRTVCFVEIDPYCQKVLKKHWPDVPIIEDIRDVTRERLRQLGIEAVDIVTGGPPCQPVSRAGKREGKADDRWLWPEMSRVIYEFEPDWVVFENVSDVYSMGLDQVLLDLENKAYVAQPLLIPACAVGAWHRRDRVFVVAHHDHGDKSKVYALQAGGYTIGVGFEILADTSSERQSGQGQIKESIHTKKNSEREADKPFDVDWWENEPELDRVVHGLSAKLDEARLHALGNAVVPQQAYPILKAIADTYSQPQWSRKEGSNELAT